MPAVGSWTQNQLLRTSLTERVRVHVAYCRKFGKKIETMGKIENGMAGGRILPDNKRTSQQ
jgi:hypothetical protein